MNNTYCPVCGKDITRTGLTKLVFVWEKAPVVENELLEIGYHIGCFIKLQTPVQSLIRSKYEN